MRSLTVRTVPLFTYGFALAASCAAFADPAPKFRAVEIDGHLGVGSDLAIADVDGDGKPDLLVADKQSLVWYRNPDWKRLLIAGKLSEFEHITISAAAKDGKSAGPLEYLAVTDGAPWDPASARGASFYLTPGSDRTQAWAAKPLPITATAHRSGWVFGPEGKLSLMEIPLHGFNDTKEGVGEGVKVAFCGTAKPSGDDWVTTLLPTSLHMSHGFIRQPGSEAKPSYLVACKEGVALLTPEDNEIHLLINKERDGAQGAGEIGCGTLPGGQPFIATVEPMHGNQVIVYTEKPDHSWDRTVVDKTLNDGHALVCGDLLKAGSDQIVAGSRLANADGKFGVNLYTYSAADHAWHKTPVDENGMSCERLALADINSDGKLDIIAAGRATKNLKVYFNESE
jgi:hypothetical protein